MLWSLQSPVLPKEIYRRHSLNSLTWQELNGLGKDPTSVFDAGLADALARSGFELVPENGERGVGARWGAAEG